MNISARLKSARVQPNYVFNVSIDIPLKYKYAITNRSYEPSPTTSPNKIKKRFKLSVTPQMIKKEVTNNQLKKNLSATLKQQIISKQINLINGFHNKKRSSNVSRKTQKIVANNSRSRADDVCPSRRTVKALCTKKSKNIIRNVSILQKMETQDNIIKYTTNSSQLKNTQSHQYFNFYNNQTLSFEDNCNQRQNGSVKLEDLHIQEIRQYQQLATQRKQHLHYQYLKQKVMILASVKKIQRAWRKYKTKKLLRSYSHNISLKIAKKQVKPNLSQQNFIQIKSSSNNLAKKKNSLLNNDARLEIKQQDSSQQQIEQIITIERKNDVNANLKQFQKQQIKKWDLILESIKKGNNIDNLLQKSEQFKKQIESQLQSRIKSKQIQVYRKNNQKQQSKQVKSIQNILNADIQKNTIKIKELSLETNNQLFFKKNKSIKQKLVYQNQGETAKKRRERINYYENQILKIDNEDYSDQKSSQSVESSSVNSYNKVPNEDFQKREKEETIKLKKKLQILQKSNLLDFGSENQSLTDRSLKRQQRQFRKQIQTENQNQVKKCIKINDPIKIQQKYSNRGETLIGQNNQDYNKKQAQNRSRVQELLNKRIQYPSDTQSESSDYQLQNEAHQYLEQPAKTHRQHLVIPDFSFLIQPYKNKNDQAKPEKGNMNKIKKISMEETLNICKFLQEELVYQSLLEFSDSDFIVKNIKTLFQNFKVKKIKPEGICTNLQSIKDYLQNFVGYIYQNSLHNQVETYLWQPSGPSAEILLKYLRKDNQFQDANSELVMKIQYFQSHWQYANQQIYFDPKFPDDPIMQKQRINYLKGLTRVYFRSIFDSFNQSMEMFRSFGQMGESYPWSKILHQQKRHSLKKAFQLSYKRIMKMSVIYCGVHFQDKNQVMSQESIKELKEDRMNNLLTFELQEDQFRWNFLQDDLAEINYQLALQIQEELLQQVMRELIQKQMKEI